MTRTRFIQMTSAAVCGAVCAGALLGVTIAAGRNVSPGPAGAFEWILPVLAGITVACVAWVLMGDVVERDRETGLGADAECAACGGAVHSDWRLCPHCGQYLAKFGRPFGRN